MMLVNGSAQALLSPADRGLSYGDGVFRTMLMRDARVRNWGRQYQKLAADCARLGMDCPASSLFEQDLAQVSAFLATGVVKIIVTRGTGDRGYAPTTGASPSRIVVTSALPSYPPQYASAGIVARWCELRLARQARLAGVKHLNRLEQVMARSEWRDPDIAEGLLQDEAGHVISGTMSNLFAIRERQLCTPDLTYCGVAGVTRDRVMNFAGKLGLQLAVAPLSQEDVLGADELLLCNSVIGVWQVRELAEKRWQSGRFAPQLRALLETDDD